MKVFILAGGLGTRLPEETVLKPKPMVKIGEMPILWHIMKIYSAHGFNDFVICLPTIYGVRKQADRLIPYLVRSLRQGERPRLSAGMQVRQYLHGRDAADLSARLLLGSPIPSGIYNVAGPDVLAIKDLVG